MKVALLFLLFVQQPATHYSKKDPTGKVVPCGIVAEWKGFWQASLLETHTHSQLFDTKAEAVAWIKPYCPIEDAQ